MIYFDNSATTKPHDDVLNSYLEVSRQFYGNPSSSHKLGLDAEKLLRRSYQQAGQLLSVNPEEIIFTSGGTEGNNSAIKGIAHAYQNRGKHLITTVIEHPSVLDTFKSLEDFGFEVSYLPVDQSGILTIETLKSALREDTILVSVMHVNHELGTIQPIDEIGSLLKNRKDTFFHVDHVQGFGKIKIDFKKNQVDLAKISDHKIHSLNGTDLMCIGDGVCVATWLHRGGKQNNRRSGTEDLAGCGSLVKDMRMYIEPSSHQTNHFAELNHYLQKKLAQIPEVKINTPENQADHIINLSIPGLMAEVVMRALEERQIYLSTQSACSSKQGQESAVLQAIHLPRHLRKSALRVSFSYQNTLDEIDLFIRVLKKIIDELKKDMR